MSSTEELIEATVTKDGTATVNILGTTHEFTAASEAAARAETVELVSKHATQRGTAVRAVMHDGQGSWPVKVHPDGTVEPDTTTPPVSSDKPAVRRRRVDSPVTHVASAEPSVTAEPAMSEEAITAETAPEPEEPAMEPAQAADTRQSATPAPAGPDAAAPKAQQPNPFAQKSQSHTVPTADEAPATRREARQSFLTQEQVEEPATQGWRGAMTRLGLRMAPSDAERAERADVQAVSQHWPGPRTIAIVNGKGGAGKTPTTVLLSAIFARYGGAGVLAWDNNQTRGTLGWRTEQGPHEATLLELLPESEKLLGTGAQSADLAHFVHHQTRDRFDVLRSKPMALASAQRVNAADVDAIHRVASKYYRLIFIDSGNDESDPMWRRMIDHTDQLVVATTTRDDHAEAGALLLEALGQQNDKAHALAQNAVAVVTQADSKATAADVKRVADGYKTLARDVATIPFDPAMVDGILRYDALRPSTQRAWLAAGAAVARGLQK
ncbi:ATPase [Arthrobacter sp. YC-RL1]|uniref:MinD/ParA family ATP-binding protein n=1 Tax=Arthrobacter sp. YC-RL1 TaxID=1652545 RepID=UPI00063DC332|nr:AAA family ATPase [Arthrobacter sp. YC-RL1]ALQ32540.1 ATPase [Arthrobacter sp. YC-RL1]KLI90549.1 ATPase [Arthrobacter sp. YC-RL1]